MVSYKNILSTVVLIFLYLRTTTTFEQEISKMRECIKHMILGCRLYQNQDTNFRVLQTHKRCIKSAIKFWIAGIPFPDVIESYFTELEEYIDSSLLDSPEDYCNGTFKDNIGKKNTCLTVMKDFENINSDIDDSKHALSIALYKRRLHNYLDDTTPANLNNYGLNFNERFDASEGFLRQISGLEEAGVNTTKPLGILQIIRVHEPNEYAADYLMHIANTAVLNISGARMSPYLYCYYKSLSRRGRVNFKPELHLSNLFD